MRLQFEEKKIVSYDKTKVITFRMDEKYFLAIFTDMFVYGIDKKGPIYNAGVIYNISHQCHI